MHLLLLFNGRIAYTHYTGELSGIVGYSGDGLPAATGTDGVVIVTGTSGLYARSADGDGVARSASGDVYAVSTDGRLV